MVSRQKRESQKNFRNPRDFGSLIQGLRKLFQIDRSEKLIASKENAGTICQNDKSGE